MRVADDFGIDAASPAFVQSLLYGLQVGEVYEFAFNPEPGQSLCNQQPGVAEEVVGTDDGLAAGGEAHQSVGYRRHSGAEGVGGAGSREFLDFLLKVDDGWVGDSGVVRERHPSAEGISHNVRVRELVGGCMIDRHTQGSVCVRSLVCAVYGLGTLFHCILSVCFWLSCGLSCCLSAFLRPVGFLAVACLLLGFE